MLRPGQSYLASASTAALAIWASSAELAPDTPMAPTVRPPMMIGSPPSIGVMPQASPSYHLREDAIGCWQRGEPPPASVHDC